LVVGCHPAARDAHLPRERFQGGIEGFLDELAEPIRGIPVERRLDPAAAGHGLERSALTPELGQLRDERSVNRETIGDLLPVALGVVDGVEEALTKIVRQGMTQSPPGESTFKSCVRRMGFAASFETLDAVLSSLESLGILQAVDLGAVRNPGGSRVQLPPGPKCSMLKRGVSKSRS